MVCGMGHVVRLGADGPRVRWLLEAMVYPRMKCKMARECDQRAVQCIATKSVDIILLIEEDATVQSATLYCTVRLAYIKRFSQLVADPSIWLRKEQPTEIQVHKLQIHTDWYPRHSSQGLEE